MEPTVEIRKLIKHFKELRSGHGPQSNDYERGFTQAYNYLIEYYTTILKSKTKEADNAKVYGE